MFSLNKHKNILIVDNFLWLSTKKERYSIGSVLLLKIGCNVFYSPIRISMMVTADFDTGEPGPKMAATPAL